MITRRGLMVRGAILGAGGAALWLLRDRLPWPPARARFADGRETPWLPMTGTGGLIELDAAIGGRAVRALVDSGAQVSAIDRALADELRLPRTVAAPMLAYGVSGGPSLTHRVVADLDLPGLRVDGLRPAALPLAAVAAATGRDFQLLIGRDVLREAVIEADFPAGRARLLAPGAYRPPRDALAIPLRLEGGAPMASLKVEGGEPIEVLVDTGATGLLALAEQGARDAGLLGPGRRVDRAHSVSLGGVSLDRVAYARSVRIGDLMLEDVPVQIYTPATHAPTPKGLLGAGLFRRFRLALDLAHGRLFLIRPGLMVIAPERLRRRP